MNEVLSDATQGWYSVIKADQQPGNFSETPEWFAWLADISSFHFAGRSGSFTARKTRKQRGGDYWYA